MNLLFRHLGAGAGQAIEGTRLRNVFEVFESDFFFLSLWLSTRPVSGFHSQLVHIADRGFDRTPTYLDAFLTSLWILLILRTPRPFFVWSKYTITPVGHSQITYRKRLENKVIITS